MNVSSYLQTLSNETHKPEEEIIKQAIQIGLRQMWRERILGQYLKKEISRETAIESVGLDYVELAERQHQAVLEDLKWAMGS